MTKHRIEIKKDILVLKHCNYDEMLILNKYNIIKKYSMQLINKSINLDTCPYISCFFMQPLFFM